MSSIGANEKIDALAKRQGLFGFGFSNNNHLDLLNLVVLACSGIIISIFFRDKHDINYGNSGPALSVIWGYGITAVALFLMLFMSFYLKKRDKILEIDGVNSDSNESLLSILLKFLLNDSLPILLVFSLLVYAIYQNSRYFIKINSNRVAPTYSTYEFYFTLLLVIQIGLIVKYMYNLLSKIDGVSNTIDNKQSALIKSLNYILSTVNFIFLLILHILLVFFSTDG
tara:strand:- start:1033 stop:1710 length:678 start_codon:yes stop_codon:yes gene_type:complete